MNVILIVLYTVTLLATSCQGKLVNDMNISSKSKANEYIVKLASGDGQAKALFQTKAIRSHMFTTLQSTRVGDNTIFLLKTKTDMTSTEVEHQIVNNFGDDVIYVTKNYIVTASVDDSQTRTYDCSSQPDEATCRSEPHDQSIWGLTRISNLDPFDHPNTDHVYRWSHSNDGDDVTIYVIDSGVYLTHDEFDDVEVRHGFTGSQLEDEGPEDRNGHGTHVAGIAVGKQYGVAKRSKLVSVKVLGEDGSGSLYDVLAGLSYVTSDFLSQFASSTRRPKAVVNLSLGLRGVILLMDEAIRHGSELGLIYVAAAGNEAIDACATTPGGSPEAITVGAIDRYDALTWFSNYGECVDILAPGEDILSADVEHSSDSKKRAGTSMAAPFVAGVIARHLSHSVNASNVTCVREHLANTAILDQASIPGGAYVGTPNRILFAGCNTCFGDYDCEASFEENEAWTLPTWPENWAPKKSFGMTWWISALVTLYWTKPYMRTMTLFH